jgi:hypothetical protein
MTREMCKKDFLHLPKSFYGQNNLPISGKFWENDESTTGGKSSLKSFEKKAMV